MDFDGKVIAIQIAEWTVMSALPSIKATGRGFSKDLSVIVHYAYSVYVF